MDDPPSVLLVILDLHPLSWAASADPEQQSSGMDTITLDRALNELLVFLNAHLALKWGNELMVYVAMAGGKSELLYSSQAPSVSLQHSLPGNAFEPFHSMSQTIKARLRELVKQQENGFAVDEDAMDVDAVGEDDKAMTMLKDGPAIVPALLRALCHINRLHPIHSNSHGQLSNIQASATGLILENPDAANGVKARVLIVNNTPERGSGGYVGLMNSVFAAQKRKIPIDVVNLHPIDSIFLQQASHLTHGIYYKIPKRAAFLTYLNLIFLPPPHLRDQLGLPPQDKVDFRAVCFCHQRVVDIGSKFPITSVQQLRKALPTALQKSLKANGGGAKSVSISRAGTPNVASPLGRGVVGI
ncbi:hypothetical protein QFC21_005015 [Naganishia friedmannii]|uniref:Uncharacterized protein n=1 Tax=Naganishia friedmannii TaxID=89922 RepID=A0ACC2VBJ7_9TREE|nr:hypothetical protein QFC21_005015 [Naganishia friedmannii]